MFKLYFVIHSILLDLEMADWTSTILFCHVFLFLNLNYLDHQRNVARE